jgi:predicted HicB family RNase H-like nuclease
MSKGTPKFTMRVRPRRQAAWAQRAASEAMTLTAWLTRLADADAGFDPSEFVEIPCTDEELAAWEAAAAKEGKSLEDWIILVADKFCSQ